MKSVSKMNIGELGAFICSHLEQHKIKVTLSGGACVSIYSSNKYESFDLDFIEQTTIKRSELKSILAEIGFKENGRYFVNPDTKYFIEFPPGPLTVGEEPVLKPETINFQTGNLRLLSPTDCIKDRLSGYYHWNDLQCLEQAKLVAHNNQVDFNELERWSKNEGKLIEFIRIKKALAFRAKQL